jgi:hypothetical protein
MAAVLLDELLDPARAALVTCECQLGVLGGPLGEGAVFPALAEAAGKVDLVGRVRELGAAARSAGVPVLHCTALRREDGRGANRNARLFAAAARSGTPLAPGSDAAAYPGCTAWGRSRTPDWPRCCAIWACGRWCAWGCR